MPVPFAPSSEFKIISLALIFYFRKACEYPFFQIFSLKICFNEIFFLSLQMFHADDESQDLSDGWDDILEKAFAKRFDFDSVELRNL